jgi:penicillin-binding protein 1A
VTDGEGRTLYQKAPVGEQRFEPQIADQVNATLQRVITNGTATKGLAVGRDVAGKTGTTDDNKSAWFVGYGPQVSTSVMLSKEDAAGNPVSLRGTGGMAKVFGSSFPLGIWTAYTADYLAGQPATEFVEPQRRSSSNNSGSSRDTFTPRQWAPAPRPSVAPQPEEQPSASPEPVPSEPAPSEPAPPSEPAEPSPPPEPSEPATPPGNGGGGPPAGDGAADDPAPAAPAAATTEDDAAA